MAAINRIPQAIIVWGIIGANLIVFALWNYAEQVYVGLLCFQRIAGDDKSRLMFIHVHRNNSTILHCISGCARISVVAGTTSATVALDY
jgi:hypothetical protein